MKEKSRFEPTCFGEAGVWVKAGFHCHTVNSDGGLTPSMTVEEYRGKGYHYTFAVFCKRLFHAGLQEPAEIGLIFANPHEMGVSLVAYSNFSKNCESIGISVSWHY
jgi:hypothetical protein